MHKYTIYTIYAHLSYEHNLKEANAGPVAQQKGLHTGGFAHSGRGAHSRGYTGGLHSRRGGTFLTEMHHMRMPRGFKREIERERERERVEP